MPIIGASFIPYQQYTTSTTNIIPLIFNIKNSSTIKILKLNMNDLLSTSYEYNVIDHCANNFVKEKKNTMFLLNGVHNESNNLITAHFGTRDFGLHNLAISFNCDKYGNINAVSHGLSKGSFPILYNNMLIIIKDIPLQYNDFEIKYVKLKNKSCDNLFYTMQNYIEEQGILTEQEYIPNNVLERMNMKEDYFYE
jgi:hypothetical protein